MARIGVMPMPPAMKISRFGSAVAISNSFSGGSTATASPSLMSRVKLNEPPRPEVSCLTAIM